MDGAHVIFIVTLNSSFWLVTLVVTGRDYGWGLQRLMSAPEEQNQDAQQTLLWARRWRTQTKANFYFLLLNWPTSKQKSDH